MNALIETATLERKVLLSTLWIFVLFNMIFRDIHDLFRPGLLAEMMTGTVNGTEMSAGFLLLAGVLLEIAIAMVPLSRILTYRANRWANIIAGALTIVFIAGNGVADLDDIFFAAVEVVALLLIIRSAWTWSEQEA